MKVARSLVLVGAAWFCLAPASSVSAWGWQGHEYVGATAWKLLNPSARKHVSMVLGPGVTLPMAAVWADCAKNVEGPPGYELSQQYLAQVCNNFQASDRQAMWEYTRRNWSNCEYAHRSTNCHKAFHFADVNVHQHDDYNEAYFGAQKYDVVHAINALMIKLKCDDGQMCDVAPFPGDIATKREALILLAHFVGDVHQPLHVGAAYLDPNNFQETDDSGMETIGGERAPIVAGWHRESPPHLGHRTETRADGAGNCPGMSVGTPAQSDSGAGRNLGVRKCSFGKDRVRRHELCARQPAENLGYPVR